MNLDHLNSVSRENTAKVSFRLLDRMQDFPAPEQVAGIACLFFLISKTLKLPPQQLLDTAQNITAFDRLFKDEEDKVFDTVSAYVDGEFGE